MYITTTQSTHHVVSMLFFGQLLLFLAEFVLALLLLLLLSLHLGLLLMLFLLEHDELLEEWGGGIRACEVRNSSHLLVEEFFELCALVRRRLLLLLEHRELTQHCIEHLRIRDKMRHLRDDLRGVDQLLDHYRTHAWILGENLTKRPNGCRNLIVGCGRRRRRTLCVVVGGGDCG